MHLPRKKNNRRLRLLLTVPFVLVLAACSGNGPQSALEPGGPIARDIDGLWDLVFWLATAVMIFVTILYVWAIWRYREREGDETEPKQAHGNTAIESVVSSSLWFFWQSSRCQRSVAC